METESDIAHKLTENQQNFFRNFENYTGETLYFYGSITRFDYIPCKSDIDLALFTNNINSTMHKMCMFLNIKKTKLKKTILKIKNTIVHGFKVAFQKPQDDINIEISIFEEKYKPLVQEEWDYKKKKMSTPATIVFYLVKLCYYVFGIISLEQYKQLKILFMDDEINFIKVVN